MECEKAKAAILSTGSHLYTGNLVTLQELLMAPFILLKNLCCYRTNNANTRFHSGIVIHIHQLMPI